jgi:predicted nucleic acid-binding protein
MRIVLDTTILVYALSNEPTLSKQCIAVLEAISQDRVEAYTTPAVIEEFAHVYARGKTRALAVQCARDYLDLLTLLPVGLQETEVGLQLFSDNQMGAFDCMLAASALSFAADALVSADRDFSRVPSLTWWSPEACIRALVD